MVMPTAPHRAASAPRLERVAGLLTIIAFVGVVCLVSYRGLGNLNIPGRPDAAHWVLQDFRDGVYYPTIAFLEGGNPYDASIFMRRYPVWRPLPLYSPLNFIVHAPFAVIPFEPAELAYYIFTIFLTLLLARLSLGFCGLSTRSAGVFSLAALILLSRPGQMNLLLGQVTLQCVIAAYIALHCARTRPWLAALGLALTTFKPTFGLPLAVLMLCRRDTSVVVMGLAIAGVLSAAGAGMLVHAAGGVAPLIASMLASHQGFTSQSFNDALLGPFRVDTPALATRVFGVGLSAGGELIIGLAVLSIGAFAVWRLADREREQSDTRHASATLVCLTVLACTYHQTYDWLLLVLPATALAADRWGRREARRPALRWLLLAALLLPTINYFATASAIEWFHIAGGWWLIVTSLNASALLFAFAVYVRLAVQRDGAVEGLVG